MINSKTTVESSRHRHGKPLHQKPRQLYQQQLRSGVGLSKQLCQLFVLKVFFSGVIKLPISGESNNANVKQFKCMVFFEGFPLKKMPCLGWKNIMTTVFGYDHHLSACHFFNWESHRPEKPLGTGSQSFPLWEYLTALESPVEDDMSFMWHFRPGLSEMFKLDLCEFEISVKLLFGG